MIANIGGSYWAVDDLQVIVDPVLNPNDDVVWIAGVRARLTM